MGELRRLCVAAIGALVIATSGPARGETQSRDEASTVVLRVRFAEGSALEAVGRWADALERFEAIARERPTAEVQFHIGLCNEHLGRLRRAERAYAAARDRARGTAPIVEAEAQERLADLETRVPRLVIDLGGPADGVTVMLDGAAVAPGDTMRVDPGPHLAVAVRGGVPIAAVAFAIQERRSRRVTLKILLPSGVARRHAPGGASPIARATPSR